MNSLTYEDLVDLLVEGKVTLLLAGVELWKTRTTYSGDDLLSCEDLEALVLNFESNRICIACEGETDEVRIVKNFPFDAFGVADLSHEEPWKSAVANELFSVWRLTNSKGYDDGLQFEFGTADENTRILVDGAASQIRIWTIKQREHG